MTSIERRYNGISQQQIDEVRYRVWLHFLRHVIENKVSFVGMRHIWFPEPATHAYELRTGNPPNDRDRPWWLCKRRLEIDCTEIPDWLREAIRPGGNIDDMIESAVRDNELEAQDIHLMRIKVFEGYAKTLASKGLQ